MTEIPAKPLVVVGLGVQGLFLTRIFSRLGLPVITLGTRNFIGQLSRFGDKRVVESGDELIAALRLLSHELGHDTECYITGGTDLAFLREAYPEIYQDFDVVPGPARAVDRLLTKEECYRLAEGVGISAGRWALLRDLGSHAGHTPDHVTFPAYAKWNRNVSRTEKRRRKAWRIGTFQDLLDFRSAASEVERDNLIVQSSLGESSSTERVSFGGYFSEGFCRAGIAVRQVRQASSGLFSFVRQLDDRAETLIAEASQRLVEPTGLTGFCEIEFFRDLDTDDLVLMDVNPRLWGWCEMLGARHPDLAAIIRGSTRERERSARPSELRWAHLLRDLGALAGTAVSARDPGYLLRGLRDYRTPGALAFWDRHDVMPFFGCILNGLRLRDL